MSCFLVSGEVEEIIQQAKAKSHKYLYLNYQHLTELPPELLQLEKAEKLYLKYNILKKLVRIVICFCFLPPEKGGSLVIQRKKWVKLGYEIE